MNGVSTLAAPDIRPLETVQKDLREAVERGREGLLNRQRSDGHWVGELQGDSILESEYILLMAVLGREGDPRVKLAANYLCQAQMPSGGWGNYPGGPADVSVSVKAYFALKIAGHPDNADYMLKAAAVIRDIGGAEASNSFTTFYLAMLGQVPYANCPAVPPEIVLMPRWFYFNIYAMSAWSRTILVPLSIVSAHKPVRQLPEKMGIRELFLGEPESVRSPHPPTKSWFTWTNFFLRVDRALKFLERWRLTPLRRWALRKAVAWMRERYVDSDGVGAIFPPMVYNAIVLHCLGVVQNDPEMIWAMKQLEDLMIFEGDTVRLQPCVSPVWDTTLTLIALTDAGVTGDAPSIERAVDWLLQREIRRPGDWSVANPNLEPGGWCFEYRNGFYPDIDDTSMALIALSRTGRAATPSASAVALRAVNWLLGMQNRDGGWAAFDRDINREVLTKVPFADHNAMLDPSCPDITARVLEALGHFGHRPGQALVDRALAFIEQMQQPEGFWPGRWGVNYLYGTWQVLVGLKSIGYDMRKPMVRRAVGWLKSVQQRNGAWGESCRSYDDPAWAGKGEATASQTAWALLGLIAAGEGESAEVQAGIDWLLATQQEDGGWKEVPFTGTGFPKVFYLKYHLYSVYFPLMAIARVVPSSEFRVPSSRIWNPTRNSELGTRNYYGVYLMRFPLSLTFDMASYIAQKKIKRTKRYPLVLMLEPLHACNLTCTGCGRIREYEETIKDKLSVEECLASVDEAGAPIVSICGGEPLIYPGIGELATGILKRRKHIYLCTNGVYLTKKMHLFRPTSRFFFNVHIDGLEETHDRAVEREGVFQAAVEGIKAAKKAGFLVCTNTTVYKDTEVGELDQLYAYLTTLGVDGFMLSPAYGYDAVQKTNPNGAAEIFLTREQIIDKFQEASPLLKKYKMATSPIYLEFLQGKRDLTCTAWGNPTRNVKGWKGPCYLITDEHHDTFDDLMNNTKWNEYGFGKDPRCEHCMVHCGYEPSAALGVNSKFGDTFKMLKWQVS